MAWKRATRATVGRLVAATVAGLFLAFPFDLLDYHSRHNHIHAGQNGVLATIGLITLCYLGLRLALWGLAEARHDRNGEPPTDDGDGHGQLHAPARPGAVNQRDRPGSVALAAAALIAAFALLATLRINTDLDYRLTAIPGAIVLVAFVSLLIRSLVKCIGTAVKRRARQDKLEG